MKLKNLLVIKAVVCLFLGIAILTAPDFIYSLFGASLTAGGIFAAREYSASLFGNMLLAWVARDAEESTARKAIVLSLFVYDVVGVIITLMAVFSGALNPLAWLIVIIYLFFAVGFGYYLVPERKPMQLHVH